MVSSHIILWNDFCAFPPHTMMVYKNNTAFSNTSFFLLNNICIICLDLCSKNIFIFIFFKKSDQMLSLYAITKDEIVYCSVPKVYTKGLCRKHLMFCSGWPNHTNRKAFPTINLWDPQSVSYAELIWLLKSEKHKWLYTKHYKRKVSENTSDF